MLTTPSFFSVRNTYNSNYQGSFNPPVIKINKDLTEKFINLQARCFELEKLLTRKTAEALNLSNVNGEVPGYFKNAAQMIADVKKTLNTYNTETELTNQQMTNDLDFFMTNNYLGLNADLAAIGNEIKLGSEPIMVLLPPNKMFARGVRDVSTNITAVVAQWPSEVRNYSLLQLHHEALKHISMANSVLDNLKKIKTVFNKKLKFKGIIELKSPEELVVLLEKLKTKNIPDIMDKYDSMRNNIGSLIDFKPFLPKRKNQSFGSYAATLRGNLMQLKMPANERNIYVSKIMNVIIKQSEIPTQEEIAINWTILCNAILLNVAEDKAWLNIIEDTLFKYIQFTQMENKITECLENFIKWKPQNATDKEIKTFKETVIDPLILNIKNSFMFIPAAYKIFDPEFNVETLNYKAKLEKCIPLLDNIPQDKSLAKSSKLLYEKAIQTIKDRLKVLARVIEGEPKTCSLRHILKGQNCLSDMVILGPDNFEVIKNYVDKLYARLIKYEPKGFFASSKKVPDLTFPELVELLYLHELKLGGEVKKYSAFMILAILIVVLLYLIFTYLLSKPSADYKIGSQLDLIKAPIHLKSTSTVNYSNWADI